MIEDHNSQNGNTHTLALNNMSDWTADEYKKVLGYKAHLKEANEAPVLSTYGLEDSLNWVE